MVPDEHGPTCSHHSVSTTVTWLLELLAFPKSFGRRRRLQPPDSGAHLLGQASVDSCSEKSMMERESMILNLYIML